MEENTEKNEFCVLPREGDKRVGEEAFSLFERALADKQRRNLHERWTRAYKHKRNMYYKEKSTSNKPLISANLFAKHLRDTVARLTRGQPTYNFVPAGAGSIADWEDLLAKAQRLTKHHWSEREMQARYRLSVAEGETYSATVSKIVFDPDVEWQGDADWQVIDVFKFAVYPFDEPDIQRAQAVMEAQIMPVDLLRRQYPHLAEEIKADSEIVSDLNAGRDEAVENTGLGSTLSTIRNTMHSIYNTDTKEADDECVVLEVWVTDMSPAEPEALLMEQLQGMLGGGIPAPPPDMAGGPMGDMPPQGMPDMMGGGMEPEMGAPMPGQMPPEIMGGMEPDSMTPEGETPTMGEQTKEQEMLEAKYPGYIRMIRVCNGGALVLEDRPNPSINPNIPRELAANTYLFDKFPYIRTCSLVDAYDPWGRSDYENIAELIVQMNHSLSMMLKERNETAGRIISTPKDTGVAEDEIQLGRTNRISPNTSMAAQGISVTVPPGSNAELDKTLNYLKDLYYQITGSSQLESMQLAGGGSLAYKALALLKEEVDEFSREKFENYSLMLREVGRMLFSQFQNWYTERRWFEYEDGGHIRQESIEMHSDDYAYLQFPVKVSIVRGSMMPDSIVQRREQAIELYQAGGFGEAGTPVAVRALLKSLEWDGWADIVSDIEQGIYGPLVEKFTAAGVPEEIVQYLQQLFELEPDQITQAVQQGQLSPASEMITQLVETGQIEPSPAERGAMLELQKLELELQKTQLEMQDMQLEMEVKANWINVEWEAKIAKLKAEAQRLSEVAETEQMRRYVMQMGVHFDEEMLKILKAREVLRAKETRANVARSATAGRDRIALPRGGPYTEAIGIRSNNKNLGGRM